MTIAQLKSAVESGEKSLEKDRAEIIHTIKHMAFRVKHAPQSDVEEYAEELDEALRFLIVHANATEDEIDEIKALSHRSSFNSKPQ